MRACSGRLPAEETGPTLRPSARGAAARGEDGEKGEGGVEEGRTHERREQRGKLKGEGCMQSSGEKMVIKRKKVC